MDRIDDTLCTSVPSCDAPVARRPKARATRFGLVLFSGLMLCQGAFADSLRCGSRLIVEGDRIEKVQQYCGEPVEKTRTWITRKPRFEYAGQEIPFEGREDVPVDLWTYDFGPNRLMQRIRFVAGKVESIETLQHGTGR